MDMLHAPLPDNAAAIAGARTKAVVILACLLAGVVNYWPAVRGRQAAHAPAQTSDVRHGAKLMRANLRSDGVRTPATRDAASACRAPGIAGSKVALFRRRDGVRVLPCQP